MQPILRKKTFRKLAPSRGSSQADRAIRCGRGLPNSLLLALLLWAPLSVAQQSASSPEPTSPRGRTESPSDGAVSEGGGRRVPSSGQVGTQKKEIISPEVQHYEPPVYPEAAFREGLQADVQLQITVGEDGTVSDPEVVTPRGHGFDQAAKAAALKLLFTPATVDGVPRKVRIGFQYSFTVDEVLNEPGEDDVPRVGDLGGVLLLAETETPLPGVQVTVVDGLGQQYNSTTNEQGRWRIPNMAPGSYDLSIRPDGFVAIESKEEVRSGEVTDLTFRILAESAETEVFVHGERPPREVTRRTIERREIQRIPGTSGDALRSIQSLPGVARPPGLAGLLIVRGSAPEDTGVFVDGSSVPLAYHFGGLSSVVPTELIDKLDFYPGNFSVRYGRFGGGIVDVGMRKPNTDCYGDYGMPTDTKGCYHGMVQVDMIDGRMLVQGPVPGTKNWSFALAGRRSWVDTWLRPVLTGAGSNVTSAPVYYDYQAIVERNISDNDKLSFRFFGSDDKLELILADPAAQDPGFGGNLAFGTSFIRGQILYQKALTEKTNIDSMISFGSEKQNFTLGGNIDFDLQNIPLDFRTEFGHKVHETAKVNVGLDFEVVAFDVFVRAPPIPRDGEVAPGPLATQVPSESSSSGIGFRPAWYADVEWQPTQRLLLVPGIRIDYARDSGHMDTSPRLTARYSLFLPEDGAFGGRPLATTIKGGVGKFAQPPAYDQTDDVFGTPGVESNRSIHYTLGVEQDLSEQVQLSVEGYYKDLYNNVSRESGDVTGYVYANEGSGRVVGMETLLKYKPDSRFFGWIAYTLSQSLRRDCATCETRAFSYDQTHNLIMLGSYRLGQGWELGARYRVVSGPLVTPVANPNTLPSIYAGDAGSYVPLQGESYSERLPLFHQLDLRIDKNWQFRSWKMSTYLDIQNVYNNAANEAYVYNFNYSQKAYQKGLPIIPSLGVRGEF